MKHRIQILAVLSGLLVAAVGLSMIGANAADEGAAEQRTKADKTFNDGNFKDAYAIYRDLLLDADAAQPQDAATAVNALNRLDRVDEIDALLEAAVEKHPTNWAMLEAIATQFRNTQHYGFIVAGEFQRGRHRGGGP